MDVALSETAKQEDKAATPFQRATSATVVIRGLLKSIRVLYGFFLKRKKRKRLALLTTVTEENAIAVPAMIGFSSIPVSG